MTYWHVNICYAIFIVFKLSTLSRDNSKKIVLKKNFGDARVPKSKRPNVTRR